MLFGCLCFRCSLVTDGDQRQSEDSVFGKFVEVAVQRGDIFVVFAVALSQCIRRRERPADKRVAVVCDGAGIGLRRVRFKKVVERARQPDSAAEALEQGAIAVQDLF